MREADRRCIEELGIPGAVLMNSAGQAVFNEISQGPVGIVCGKGNNGGDGYVVARLSLLAGYETRVVLLADPNSIQGDARIFLDAFRNVGGHVTCLEDPENVPEALKALSECAVLVDAILGTGIAGEVRGIARVAIDAWPKVPTIAVDIPSGLNADTGAVCGVAIRADKTVTFHLAKHGLVKPEAAQYVGDLVVADIGIPAICADDAAWNAWKATN
jgi:NAD(P)H-hydrate epimerase